MQSTVPHYIFTPYLPRTVTFGLSGAADDVGGLVEGGGGGGLAPPPGEVTEEF